MEHSPELAAITQRIYDAVSTGDTTTLQAMLSARDGVMFIGTDPAEWFEDNDAIRTMLAAQAAAGVTVRNDGTVAYEEGTVGWVAGRSTFILPDTTEVPFRITAVFHRENGTWALVQEHASIAVSNEAVLGVELA